MAQLIQHLIEHRVSDKGKKSIEIDHTKIDLFKQYDKHIPPWKPNKTIKQFNKLKICVFDIETTVQDPTAPKPDPEVDRVILAGIMNQDGLYMNVENNDSEALLLKKFVDLLMSEPWDIICGYNCFEFDIPFLEARCKKHGIYFPFKIGKYEKTFQTAQMFSQPAKFYPYYYQATPFEYTAVIDLFHQVLAWDYVFRTLTSYTLKQSVIQMGLRKEARTELSVKEMMALWEKRELELFHEYLHYDLEDTFLLCNKLVPSIYYQKLLLDWSLQSISTAGNGTKWNDILCKAIGVKKDHFEAQEKEFFQGATTIGNMGLYLNCSKIDVESLYPSIMLNYGVCSVKDKDHKILSILKYLKDTRIHLKNLAKGKVLDVEKYVKKVRKEREENNQFFDIESFRKGVQEIVDFYCVRTPKDADGIQSAFKVIINSAYGFLGAKGLTFNDFEAAATVTGFGRAIFDLMCQKIVEFGGRIVTADTDGVIYSCPPGTNEEIYKKVQACMPPGIKLDFELTADAVFVPAANPEKPDIGGKKKNYLIFFPGGKVKSKGTTFNSRAFSKLNKDFPIQYLKHYMNSPSEAEAFFQDTIHNLCTRKMPKEIVCVTRKIGKNEKELVELGLGKVHEKISFMIDTGGNKILIDQGKYSISYYTQQVIGMRQDILASVDPHFEQVKEPIKA